MAPVSAALLASIPSPPNGVYHVGPLTIHMYGVMLLLAIAACIWLTGVRWVRWGGDWDLVYRVAIWGVIAGIIGARLYHDLTSWNEDPAIHDHWYGPIAVWQGGLGIWGAIPAGVLVGAWIVRRSGNSVRLFMDACAPGLLLAQAIGRIGNWWNQELYGKPTKLPWGLKIDPSHRPPDPRYIDFATFHPTFLYELLWNLLGVAVLLYVARRFTLRPPSLFALYVAWYTFGRFFEELLRIDPSKHFLGLRLNAWVSAVLFVLAVAFFLWHQRRAPGRGVREPRRDAPKGPAMAIPKGRVR
jgi:prolipoprotein diacylglyceryl transferase